MNIKKEIKRLEKEKYILDEKISIPDNYESDEDWEIDFGNLNYKSGELHALQEVLRCGIDKELNDVEQYEIDKYGEERANI